MDYSRSPEISRRAQTLTAITRIPKLALQYKPTGYRNAERSSKIWLYNWNKRAWCSTWSQTLQRFDLSFSMVSESKNSLETTWLTFSWFPLGTNTVKQTGSLSQATFLHEHPVISIEPIQMEQSRYINLHRNLEALHSLSRNQVNYQYHQISLWWKP